MSDENNTNTITLSHVQDDGSIVLYLNEADSANWSAVVWPDGSGHDFLPDGSSEPETRELGDEARAFAREIRDHLKVAENCLWQDAHQSCPLPYAHPQDVPHRRLIGSMGFKPWKAARDAAIIANQQYADRRLWCRNYEAKHWPQWEADVLAFYR